MSAFICSDSHIFAIACAVYPGNPALAQALADKLKSINIDSVNYRYNEKTPRRKCKPAQAGILLHVDDTAKLIDCWGYQSCENPQSLDFLAFRALLDSWVKLAGANPKNGKHWSI